MVNDCEMHTYYVESGEFPTFANFRSKNDLESYCKSRERFFRLLNLPVHFFKGLKLIEFGPDTGENAMVFSSWGSKVFLVEPNKKSADQIRRYFNSFNLASSMIGMSNSTIQDIEGCSQYDMVVAEGFLHTVRPNSIWFNKFSQLMNRNGLMLISYLEEAGAAIEIFHKVIYRYIVEATGEDTVESAKSIFQRKWDSVTHTRAFNAWYMDVIKNPYVRRRFFNCAETLVDEAKDKGFSLYSSWPIYKDSLDIFWAKAEFSADIQHDKTKENIARSKLSFLLGTKCYCTDSLEIVEEVYALVAEFVKHIDFNIDGICRDSLKKADCVLVKLIELLNTKKFLIGEDKQVCCDRLLMLRKIISFILSKDSLSLLEYCQESEIFISSWGLPNHNVIFQYQG